MKKSYYLTGTANSTPQLSKQFADLVSELSLRGFISNENISSEYFISINHDPKSYKNFLKFGGDSKKTVLILLEPRAVYPSQYSSKILESYSLIMAPGNPTFRDSNGDFVPWPYEIVPNPAQPVKNVFDLKSQIDQNVTEGVFNFENWKSRENFIILINANKVGPGKSQNYSLRRKFARRLPASSLSVFGDLWQSSIGSKIRHRLSVAYFAIRSGYLPSVAAIYGDLHWKYKTSKGLADDKHGLLRKSKFSIVIENDSSYMSEKLLDVLVNGSIPIYHGLRLSLAGIPENVIVNLHRDPSILIPKLDQLTEHDIQLYLSNIEKFVSSSDFVDSWSKKAVFRQIAISIASHFGFDDV